MRHKFFCGDKLSYPQLCGELWGKTVDNSAILWKKSNFPVISRKFAVDNPGENRDGHVGKLGISGG